MAVSYASEYRDQVVEISRLALNDTVIEGVTFAHCTVIGPAVLLPLENCEIVESSWDAPDFDAIVWPIANDRDLVIGAIGLRNCHFSACRFRDIGLAVRVDRVDEIRSGFEGD